MAKLITAIICSIISLITFTTFTNAQSNITRGSSLNPTGTTASWLSPSGLYAFGFYPQTDGYGVGIYIAGVSNKTVVWTAGREILPVVSANATLRFTSDGRLTVEQTRGQQFNLFDTNGASFASMQDSGNFVFYDSSGRTVWQSFDHPTETLLAGQRLRTNQMLFSSVSETDHSIGVSQLRMQDDGNLVLYPNDGTPVFFRAAYWVTGTYTDGPNVTLNLDSDGFLYLLQNSSFYIYNLTGGYPIREDAIYVLRLDVDGILRLYNMGTNGSVLWQSSTDKCVAKGLCGNNGYCSVVNDVANCRCLPGFEFVNPDRWSSGKMYAVCGPHLQTSAPEEVD